MTHLTPVEMESRLRFRRAKPGSLYSDGSIVSDIGMRVYAGPCFIPDPRTKPHTPRRAARLRLINEAGWRTVPAKDWPGFAPTQDHICIERSPPSAKD